VFYELMLKLLQSGLLTFENINNTTDVHMRCLFIIFAFEQIKDSESIPADLSSIIERRNNDLELQ
jgi:kynurenine formamidase